MSSAAALYRTPLMRAKAETLADATITALALIGSLLLMRHGGLAVTTRGSGEVDVATVSLVACSTLPLLAWRRSPFAAFVVTGIANVALAAIVSPIGVPLGPAAALYLLAASRDETSPSIRRITTAAVVLLVAYVAAAATVAAAFPTSELLHAGLLWAVAWFAGERSRLRREQVAELVRDAQRERLLAAAEERARIARDLHDSAGHAINVIAVRAGAARLRYHEDPDQCLGALESIEDLARRTAEEIDHFVGALRERTGVGTDVVETPPGLASVPTLVEQHAGAGLDIDCTVTGTGRRLASAVDQAAYRILQEALTNASRHGSGPAHVAIAFGDTAVELRVANRIAAGRSSGSATGHGLVGMSERAILLGGDLAVEPRDGVFSVCARLPYQPAPS